MSQQPKNRASRYHIFLLSLWEAGSSAPDGPALWRYSLEHGPTGERRGFKGLAELTAYLEAWTREPAAPQDSGKVEPCDIPPGPCC